MPSDIGLAHARLLRLSSQGPLPHGHQRGLVGSKTILHPDLERPTGRPLPLSYQRNAPFESSPQRLCREKGPDDRRALHWIVVGGGGLRVW